MEDVDTQRAREEVEAHQREDLEWLGFDWDEETPRQSARDYAPAVAALRPHTYRCICTRAQLKAQSGPNPCRDAHHEEGALRLRLTPGTVTFADRRWGMRTVDPSSFGDPVLQRRDGLHTYNLAVVTDDIRDGVTEVVRGSDLLDYTAVQIRIWELLGATPPTWLHSPMVLGSDGQKLSKSHGSASIRVLRDQGARPADIWRIVLPFLGMSGSIMNASAFTPDKGPLGPLNAPA